MFSTFSPILWTAFIAFVLLALAVDLGVFHRQARTISLREAIAWSIIWVVFSLAFNFFLLRFSGRTAALDFFTGYVIEKSLSVDNLFVFVLLFRYFAVESRATPFFLVLLVVETTDLAFALDSVPAIFAITPEPFIVFSSNACAILGLRAFYFLLAGVLPYVRQERERLSLTIQDDGKGFDSSRVRVWAW